MIQILKGNSITLQWAITIDGQVTDLTDKNVKVYIISNRFKKQVTLTKNLNVLSFTFNGSEQPFDGIYDLELFIDEGQTTQQRLYESAVFQLTNEANNITINTNISE